MHCQIEWNSLSLDEWNSHIKKIRRAPVLQSYDYALATYSYKGQHPLWGLIIIDGREEGIVQIAEAKAFGTFLHAIILDQGPLWFNTNNLKQKSITFFKELNRQFPKRIGRKRRIIPHIPDKAEFDGILENIGYKSQKGSYYETIWLDLTVSITELRSNLKQKWRNQLNKSERQNLDFCILESREELRFFLQKYDEDFHFKKYKNIHPKHIKNIYKQFTMSDNIFVSAVKYQDHIIALSLILINGYSATYQIGWINKTGRNLCANHFLIWKNILYLKDIYNVKDFDLGGINPYDAKGIQHFKKGLNGKEITYKGIYS